MQGGKSMVRDLREFIDRVKELGELKVIEGANWDMEVGPITYLAAEGSKPPALLFDKVKGYKAGYRILALPCSTDKRTALALGLPLETSRLELVRRLRDKLNEPLELVPPVEVKEGPIMENVHIGDEVDLFEFPTPKWQVLDGGRYIGTGDTVIMKDPDEGWVNLGTHRVQIHDKSTATIYFDGPGRHGDMIRRKYWRRGQNCPVAVTCGSDPLLVLGGTMRIPWGISEYDYIGWWRKEPVQIIKGPTTGLPIPAYAEIVLEGEMVPPEVETRQEGPFSEFTGHYTPERPEAAFRVKCVLHQNDPIILAVLPFVGFGATHWLTPIVRAAQVWNQLDRMVPGVKGVWEALEFGPVITYVISLAQQYGGHAKQAAMSALSTIGYMVKYVIVVDDDVDPSNLREVLFALGLRAEPESFEIIRGCWDSEIDPLLSPEKRAAGDITHSSAIILACKPYHWIKRFPPSVKPSPELLAEVKGKWGRLLV